MNGVRHFLLALQFFTRIPVTGRLARWVGFSPAMLRASAAHFPGVGWVVGGVAVAVLLLARTGLQNVAGAAVAVLLSTLATVLLTGAFHEDGLADTADGLGGAVDRQRALEIMKDSRIGTYGALALVLTLGLKTALLTSMALEQTFYFAAVALLFAHVLSRLAPLFVIRALAHVGDGATSKSKPLADAITGRTLAVGCLWAAPAIVLGVFGLGLSHTAAAWVAAAATAWLMIRWLRRRLGGFTGDTLGATQQICELAIYLALAWRP